MLRSYDSCANSGLQYPLSPGARGKYGDFDGSENNISRAGEPPALCYADTAYSGAAVLTQRRTQDYA